jgi:hypothetical protein
VKEKEIPLFFSVLYTIENKNDEKKKRRKDVSIIRE